MERRKAVIGIVAGLVGIGLVVASVYVVSSVLRSVRLLGGSEAALTLILEDAAPGETIEVFVSGGGVGHQALDVGGDAVMPVLVEVVLQPKNHALNSYGSAVSVTSAFSDSYELEIACEGPVDLDRFGRVVAPASWPADTDIEATCRVTRVPRG